MNDYQNKEIEMPYPYTTGIDVIQKEVLPPLQKLVKLMEKATGERPHLRVQEIVLTSGSYYTFTDDNIFTHWCIYNTCENGGFIRIGPNMTSVPVSQSLYLGQNGKVIFPAISRFTSVINPSLVSVDVFAVSFTAGFDIWF